MEKRSSARKFDLIELLLTAVCLGLCGLFIGRSVPRAESYPDYMTRQEAERLKATYGPGHYSENDEEWIIRDFFHDRREGYFVDVGASRYKANSNTYYLEEHLGWSGIAIEPQAEFAADYAKYRPRTRFFSFFASDVSDRKATLYIAGPNDLAASGDKAFAANFEGKLSTIENVPTITLTDLLNQLGVPHIDMISIDVELSEPKVLSGFDVERFRPALVCIEAHPQVRQRILDYFARHGYVALGKYLRVDGQNLYFTPLP